jgi:hypothetical protein
VALTHRSGLGHLAFFTVGLYWSLLTFRGGYPSTTSAKCLNTPAMRGKEASGSGDACVVCQTRGGRTNGAKHLRVDLRPLGPIAPLSFCGDILRPEGGRWDGTVTRTATYQQAGPGNHHAAGIVIGAGCTAFVDRAVT